MRCQRVVIGGCMWPYGGGGQGLNAGAAVLNEALGHLLAFVHSAVVLLAVVHPHVSFVPDTWPLTPN